MNRFLAPIVFLLTLFLFSQCEDDNEPGIINDKISFDQTKEGGCNSDQLGLKSTQIEGPDTVSFSIKNGKLDIFVGINYICCAPFSNETKIEDNTITLTINDECDDGNYCHCMCYYTWDFYFNNFEEKTYNYRVILNDPRNPEPIVFREGEIDISTIL